MNVEEKVIEILKRNTNLANVELSDLSKVSLNDLGFNSLNFIKVIVELEDMFDIEFDDNQINYKLLSNIQKLVEMIKKLIAER